MTGGSTSIGTTPGFATLESDLYHCSACNYCVEAVWAQRGIEHVCPTLLHHSPAYGYSGLGYLAQARAWREGTDLDLASLAERAFTCTTCGNCEEACPIGLRPARVVLALRSALNERDATPAAIATLRDNVLREDNPAGAPRQARGDWARGWQSAGHLGDRLLFLPGCAGCHAAPGEARTAVAVLESCGWRVATLGDGECCCGAPLHEIGFPAEAAAKREALGHAIRDQGAGTIAVLGTECLEALNDRSAATGPATTARHPALLLHDAILAGRVTLTARADRPPPALIAVLDPCHVTKKNHGAARDGDPAAAARAGLIAAGCDVVGGAASSRHALCCGAGGAMPVMNGEAAMRMATGRIDGLAASGAAAIVTISPLCLSHLRSATSPPDAPGTWGLFEFLHRHFQVAATPTGARR
jgi:Fe-S oxidoreductase